ncbi:transcriptional regulator [Fulvivirga imtechensis AK7]|uniref:Transcriptional regulator n=1 Tax=Fulvivirga imtechensis AK7 TaxID=1237149 RepID=L8JX19_9BACT|nr:helix-turn-helix transcriptional regulator [Fulvivirga imtechensis]ELR73626.1 transcriptional regulator [Fulvivirga imtechensis AK7]
MNYQTLQPHADLASLIKCYWTLEIPAQMEAPKQRIVPDGCIEMAFILGDDIKRYTSDTNFIIQPRAMVIGQITQPFFIEPTGHVNSFAIRFYPYGFANFIKIPIKELANKETPISALFDKKEAEALTQKIVNAPNTGVRITIVEDFLLSKLKDASTIDRIVKSTIDTLFLTKGSTSIDVIVKDQSTRRRNLERKFSKQVGISPKRLGKVFRLQAALKMMLLKHPENLTQIAYESEYYDQAHFIKDFKELTGTNPKEFLSDDQMILSSLIYSKD